MNLKSTIFAITLLTGLICPGTGMAMQTESTITKEFNDVTKNILTLIDNCEKMVNHTKNRDQKIKLIKETEKLVANCKKIINNKTNTKPAIELIKEMEELIEMYRKTFRKKN